MGMTVKYSGVPQVIGLSLQATINGLRLPQTGWKTGMTIDQLEATVERLSEYAPRPTDGDMGNM